MNWRYIVTAVVVGFCWMLLGIWQDPTIEMWRIVCSSAIFGAAVAILVLAPKPGPWPPRSSS